MWGRRRTTGQPGKSTQKMIQQKQKNTKTKPVIAIGVLQPPTPLATVKQMTYEHPKGYAMGQVKGMNTLPFNFSVMTKGNSVDGNLFVVDTGNLLQGHNGILSITALKLILFGVPQKDVDTIPEVFYLTCQQLNGLYDQTGNTTNIVASSTPIAISSSLDQFNLQTASIIYGMNRDSINWDLSSIPNLTFQLKIGMDRQDAIYPLQTEVLVQFTVVKIMI